MDALEKDFYSEKRFPFSATNFWHFFNFSRRDNFIRFLLKEQNKKNIIISQKNKLNNRTGTEIFFNRNLFYDLSEKFNINHIAVINLFLNYNYNLLKSKILKFKLYSKKEYIYGLNISSKIKGHFYTYSLNTVNLALDLNIDPFDLFKFCNYECNLNISNIFSTCTRGYSYRIEYSYPYFSFDNEIHEKRLEFISLIEQIRAKFQLSSFQKKLIDKYLELIKELLNKQLEFDKEEERYQEPQNKYYKFNYIQYQKKELTVDEKIDLKKIYRKAAFLCHPDKIKGKEDVFKELNNANQNNDLYKVKLIYQKLFKQ